MINKRNNQTDLENNVDDVLLDDIVDDFLLRTRNGEKPSIEEYQQRYPDHADQIADLLKTVRFVDKVRDESSDGLPYLTQEPALFTARSLGAYDILGRLGQGGMGTVYRAQHRKLKRVVALKMLSMTKMGEADVARFEREMAATGQLNHPNIVVAYDAGEVDGQHFLAMELLDGHDLSRVSEACSPMEIGAACELVRQATIGLQHAHAHDFVHRDIKPSNLMLTSAGTVKILDLGLARSHHDNDQGEITNTGQVMGTIDYMASEQCADSHTVDIRADIYSLGATLYRLLTGVAPFAGPDRKSTVQKLMLITSSDPPSIATHRDDLPVALVEIVDRAVRKDADHRFSDPAEFGTALEPFADATEIETVLQTTSALVKETAVEDTFFRDPSLVDTSRKSMVSTFTGPPARGNQPAASNQPAEHKQRNRPRVWIGLGLLLTCMLIAIASILTWKTDDGTITVDTGGVPVDITFRNDKASFSDPTDGKLVEVSIDKKRNLLLFEKEGFRSIGESFEIAFREKRVAISFAPNQSRGDIEGDMETGLESGHVTQNQLHNQAQDNDTRNETIRWALENGLVEINLKPVTPEILNHSLPYVRQIGVRSNGPERGAKLLAKLLSVVQPQLISIMRGAPLDNAFATELSKAKNATKLAVYCRCETEAFSKLSPAFTSGLTELIMLNHDYPVSDDMIALIAKRCPKLQKLDIGAEAISSAAIDTISKTQVHSLGFLRSKPKLQSKLGALTNLSVLSINNPDGVTSLDLSNLPPNINTLWLSGQELGSDEFKALDQYPRLNFISLNGAWIDTTAADQFRRAHPKCRIENYLVENSSDDFLPWAFANGLNELCYHAAGQAQPPASTAATLANAKIESIELVMIENTEHTVKILRGLNDLASIEKIAIKGRRSFDDPLLRQLESLRRLSGLYIYCPHTPEQLTGLSVSARRRIIKLGFFCPIDKFEVTNAHLEKVLPAFPNLDDLGLLCTKVSEACLDSIVKRNVGRLVLEKPNDAILRSLDALESVVHLQLAFDDVYESASELRLPPNLVMFWIDGAFLDKGCFDAVKKCESIRSLIPRNAKSLDREALKAFQAARPHCAVELGHVGL